MSDAKTNYLENAILDHILGNDAFTPPADIYLALLTADPGEPGSLTEASGNGYARQLITFAEASGGQAVSNNNQIFSDMPACKVTHVVLMDAVSGGNALYYKSLPSEITLLDGNELTFVAGNIIVSEK